MDIRKIGGFISELRKSKELTQAELAGLLNVSHQAVSKWERGESLPDIGLLPMLAALLDITIDELLNGEAASARLPSSFAPIPAPIERERNAGGAAPNWDVPETDAGQTNQLQTFAARADRFETDADQTDRPETYAGQTDQLLTYTDRRTDHREADAVKPNQLQTDAGETGRLAPITLAYYSSVAPFLSKSKLESMAERIAGEVDWPALNSIATFVSSATLERLIGRATGNPIVARHIVALAPFLDKKLLERLALNEMEEDSIDWNVLQGLCPFLNRTALSQLVRRVKHTAATPMNITGLAPFLDQADLVLLVGKLGPAQLSPEHLSALAPFLPREWLDRLVVL